MSGKDLIDSNDYQEIRDMVENNDHTGAYLLGLHHLQAYQSEHNYTLERLFEKLNGIDQRSQEAGYLLHSDYDDRKGIYSAMIAIGRLILNEEAADEFYQLF